jgi:hypothetical protein
MSAGTEHDSPEPKPRPEGRERWGSRWKLIIVALIGTYALVAAYALFSVFTSGKTGLSSIASASTTTSPAPVRHVRASMTATPRDLPTSASIPAPHSLAAASVAAFGPEGAADGDNPAIVSRIDDGGTQPWYSSWYATPELGNLKSGTGLLFDMGNAVTISSVRLALGSEPGADIQVRVGNSETMAGMATVASAADAGSTVRLSVTPPSKGRYVLVWFTRLPPNSQGEYQIDVYGVTIDGTDR